MKTKDDSKEDDPLEKIERQIDKDLEAAEEGKKVKDIGDVVRANEKAKMLRQIRGDSHKDDEN